MSEPKNYSPKIPIDLKCPKCNGEVFKQKYKIRQGDEYFTYICTCKTCNYKWSCEQT